MKAITARRDFTGWLPVLLYLFYVNAALAEAASDAAAWRTLVVSAAEAKYFARLDRPITGRTVEEISIKVPAEWLEKWAVAPATLPWTDETLRLIVKYQQNPLRAGRVLGYVHAAAHDALVVAKKAGLDGRLTRVAVHSAAAAMLEYFYPQEPEGRFGAMGRSAMQAEGAHMQEKRELLPAAWTIGQQVAEAAKDRARLDGAARRWNIRNRPPHKPGRWQAAPPLNAFRPAEPLAGEWRTWLLKDGAEFFAPPPTQYDSPAYWDEVREVLDVHSRLTPDQKKIADDWNLGLATITPPGVWNLKARELALDKKLGTEAVTRLFAALNAAMIDAFIACWHVKFTYWTERPVTAIRARFQPDFLPYLVTPAFPSYVSGHATVSGAASEVLAAFFPAEAAMFRSMAQEAALSRLYGGIHFRSDNEHGLVLGQRIGQTVVKRLNGN